MVKIRYLERSKDITRAKSRTEDESRTCWDMYEHDRIGLIKNMLRQAWAWHDFVQLTCTSPF